MLTVAAGARNAVAGLAALAAALLGAGGAVPQARAQAFDQPFQEPPKPAPKAPQLTKPPKLLTAAEPVYPPEALADQIAADVTLVVDLDATGAPTRVEVKTPVGHGFDESATAAVLQSKFSPAEVDGKPAPIRFEYTLHFVPKLPPPEAPADGGAADGPPPPPADAAPPPPPEVVLVVGRLREKGTRDPLRDGEVAVIARSPDGVEKPAAVVGSTDAEGRFEVKGQPGFSLRVIVTEASHDPCIRDLDAGSMREGAPAEIDCLVARRLGGIYETKVRAAPPAQAVTRYQLAQPELSTVPGTFGDPLRVVQNLPGVARTPFGLGALVIRGASPTDSGIYVEGHAIPLLYHFLGGPSVLTPRLIKTIDFYPGNFGVRYGRATAGIVDVGVVTDPMERLHGSADINFLDSSAYVQGPLGGKWSGSVSARRSYIDVLLPLVLPSSTTTAAPVYYDYQAGVHRELGAGRLAFFAFGSNDTLKVVTKDPAAGSIDLGTETGFHKVIGVWSTPLRGGWTNRLSPAYGYERLRFGAGTISVDRSAHVFSLREEPTRAFTPWLTFRTGFDGEMRRDSLFFDLPVLPDTRIYGNTIPMNEQRTIPLDTAAGGLFADVTADLGHGLTVIPGVRVDGFRYVGQNRLTFDPRLVARWKQSDKQLWKAGVGLYHQMPEPQLLNTELGNPNLPPIWADQYSLGFVRRFTDVISLDTTFYFVRRHDQPVPPPPFTADGKGRSYGMELILKHDFTDKFFGWLAYTLSRSEQTVYAVNAPQTGPGPGGVQSGTTEPKYFPTDFDQTHNLIMVASYAFNPKWRLGSRFRVVTGSPDTPLMEGAFDAEQGTYVCAQGPTNSIRKPTFHQLDIRVDRTWTFNSWQLGAYLDVQNVYNAENREFTVYDYRCRTSVPVRGIPFLPVLGIKGMF